MSDKLAPKIIVIESDEVQSAYICNTIERSRFDVERVSNAADADKAAILAMPNIAIISSKLNASHSVKIANNIRKSLGLTKLPIIFLLEHGEEATNYQLADNNLVELLYKPFTPNQIIAVIKSLLRKSQPIFQDKIIKYKDIRIDLATYKVYRQDKSIRLGPTEFKILQLLVQSPNVIYSREQIINYVWEKPRKIIEPRTVDVHVNRLRSLMSLEKNEVPLIQTVRSKGYCLNLPGEKD